MKAECYEVYVDCYNCGKAFSPLAIKKGERVAEAKCPNCGCQTLIKRR